MACKGFWECLLKLLNFLFMLVGLAMIGYGIYLFVEYRNGSSGGDVPNSPSSGESIKFARPMLMTVALADSFLDNLPRAWFIYLFIGIGAVLLVVSLFGCIGTCARNGCCLISYAVLVILVILVELGVAAFIFFDRSWKEDIPTDRTGSFDMMYGFLRKHWNIVRWVALGAVVVEALIFMLALIVRAANKPSNYDSDDEYIAGPRQQIRQPLVTKAAAPNATASVPTLQQRPGRNDAWSARMREKYGIDTTEFTYNPSESNRYQQGAAQPQEEKSRCIIM